MKPHYPSFQFPWRQIGQLTFVDENLWSYLKQYAKFDVEIPRQTVPSARGDSCYEIEKQPVLIWLVVNQAFDSAMIDTRGLKGNVTPQYQLSNDELELVFKVGFSVYGTVAFQYQHDPLSSNIS